MLINNSPTQVGFSDFVDFYNAQLASPTTGVWNNFITDVENHLQAQDYYVMIADLHDQSNVYSGALIATQKCVLVLNTDKVPQYITTTSSEIVNLLPIDSDNVGLKRFYSGAIPITCLTDSVNHYTLEIYDKLELGNSTYYISINKAGIQVPLVQTQLKTRFSSNGVTSCYNVKLSRVIESVTVIAAKNQKTSFTLTIKGNFIKNYTYTFQGEILYLPSTEQSLKDISELVKKGIIFVQ